MSGKSLIEELNRSFQHSIRNGKSKKSRQWLVDRKLDLHLANIGFCSGQVHHRKPQEYKDSLVEIGFLKPSPKGTNNGNNGYSTFAFQSMVFPLHNEQGNIVNYYAVCLDGKKKEYLNDNGIYPRYPSIKTIRLFITQNVLDAATLLSADVLEHREAVISLKEGILTREIQQMISSLTHLEEVIIIH